MSDTLQYKMQLQVSREGWSSKGCSLRPTLDLGQSRFEACGARRSIGLTPDNDDLTQAHSLATRASAMGSRLVVLSRSHLEGLDQPEDLAL